MDRQEKVIKFLQENTSLILSREGFMRFYQKGRIRFEWKESHHILNQFLTYLRAVNSIFPNNWDFIYDIKVNRQDNKSFIYYSIKGIRVFIPHATVKNEKNEKHDIYELYVDVLLIRDNCNNSLTVASTKAFRTNFLDEEIKQGYTHSHVEGLIRENMLELYTGSICRGSSALAAAITKINTFGISEENAINLFVSIKSFASTESLDGGPYRYLRNINQALTKRSSILEPISVISPLSSEIPQSFFNGLKSYLKENDIFLPLIINNDKLNWGNTEEFEKEVLKFILTDEIKESAPDYLYYHIESQGSYVYFDKEELLNSMKNINPTTEEYTTVIHTPSVEKYFRGNKLVVKERIREKEVPTKELLDSLVPKVRIQLFKIIKKNFLDECNKNLSRKIREKRYKD